MRAFQQKLDAAILKTNPNLATIVQKLEHPPQPSPFTRSPGVNVPPGAALPPHAGSPVVPGMLSTPPASVTVPAAPIKSQ
jgi:hypothetical protein